MLTGAGIDPLNPKGTERPFAVSAITVGILQAFFDALDSDAETAFGAAPIATGAINGLFVAGMTSGTPFNARQGKFLP